MSAFKPPKPQRVHYTEYQKQMMAGLSAVIRQLDTLIGLESGITDKREFKARALAQRDANLMQQYEDEQEAELPRTEEEKDEAHGEV